MAAPDVKPLGKAFPLTVVTPVSWWKYCLLRIIIVFFRFSALDDVKQLRFIHFARWAIVHREAFAKATPSNKVRRHYFLFSTNYNGPWDQYIDSFSLVKVVRRGMNFLWWPSEKFPSAWPIRRFKRYIRYHEFPVDAYYNAYPSATIRDIEAALAFDQQLQSYIAANTDTPEGVAPQDFIDFIRETTPLARGATVQRSPSAQNAQPLEISL